MIVGGTGTKGHAWIPVEESEDLDLKMDGLLRENLAQTAISYVLSRVDSNRQVFDVCMLPRRLKEMSTRGAMEQAGLMWQEATAANNGLPPLSQSCDNAASQVAFGALFTGLMPDLMKKLPFLGQCRVYKNEGM